MEEQKIRTAAAKAKTGQDVEEEPEDDGFLQAFNDAADEDWPDFTEEAENADDEEETTDI